MAKVLSKFVIYIGQGVAPGTPPGSDTFDTIGNVTTASGPNVTKDEVETTDMNSTAKEFLGDLPNPGELSFSANRNFGDTGQGNVRSDALDQTLRNFRLERLDPADDSVLETADFIGEVMEWSEDGSQGAVMTVSSRVKISGSITFT